MANKGGGKSLTGGSGNGPYGKPAPKGVTPKPAGKPQGGKGLSANSNLKGGSGSC